MGGPIVKGRIRHRALFCAATLALAGMAVGWLLLDSRLTPDQLATLARLRAGEAIPKASTRSGHEEDETGPTSKPPISQERCDRLFLELRSAAAGGDSTSEGMIANAEELATHYNAGLRVSEQAKAGLLMYETRAFSYVARGLMEGEDETGERTIRLNAERIKTAAKFLRVIDLRLLENPVLEFVQTQLDPGEGAPSPRVNNDGPPALALEPEWIADPGPYEWQAILERYRTETAASRERFLAMTSSPATIYHDQRSRLGRSPPQALVRTIAILRSRRSDLDRMLSWEARLIETAPQIDTFGEFVALAQEGPDDAAFILGFCARQDVLARLCAAAVRIRAGYVPPNVVPPSSYLFDPFIGGRVQIEVESIDEGTARVHLISFGSDRRRDDSLTPLFDDVEVTVVVSSDHPLGRRVALH